MVGLVTVAGSATADPSIASKRAQAQAVLDRIQQIQVQVEQASNAYASAQSQLQQIDEALKLNTYHLGVARQNLGIAERRAAARLRSIYIHGAGGGAVEILLGAENLDDLLNRIDAARRVSRQDVQVLQDVRSFRGEVLRRQASLKRARASQSKLVAERAAQKRQIESNLGEQQRLLSSIKSEIAQLQEAERRRQAALAAAARARYAAQLQAQQEAAAAPSTAGDPATTGVAPDLGSADGGLTQPTAPAPPSPYGGVVGIALQYLGTPYVWGASGPGAFDCSGFTMFVYAQMGVSLPHNAAAQFSYGTPVSRDQLQPGDLVFFHGLSHVGLYIGNGQFVHAPHTGDVVKISSIYDSWYSAGFDGARRIT